MPETAFRYEDLRHAVSSLGYFTLVFSETEEALSLRSSYMVPVIQE